jgi:hypothetical protein
MKALLHSAIFYSLLPLVKTLPCNIFPKIFGGSSGITKSQAIDVNMAKDILVITG